MRTILAFVILFKVQDLFGSKYRPVLLEKFWWENELRFTSRTTSLSACAAFARSLGESHPFRIEDGTCKVHNADGITTYPFLYDEASAETVEMVIPTDRLPNGMPGQGSYTRCAVL